MATYTMRVPTGRGLTTGHWASVGPHLWSMVEQAAAGASWNRISSAPKGFVDKTVSTTRGSRVTKVVTINDASTASGTRDIEFQPGFNMYAVTGAQQWENHATAGGYRLDLQGIDTWANWSIQTNGTGSVSVGSCLMELESSFSRGQLFQALKRSIQSTNGALCELTA